MMVHLYSKKDWHGEEYFKVYNASPRWDAGKIARISFKEPKCDFKYKGKEIWSLNTEEKRHLMDILQSKKGIWGLDLTNWQLAILTFNMEKGLDWDETKENLISSGTLKYHEYLPFDLPIPNYMEL